MKRSVIIIAVERTGGLPTLQDAVRGARRFEEWAVTEGGVKPGNVHVFTDENNAVVEVKSIWRKIDEIVESGTTRQLIIYFAGHGVNIGRNEFWLLSDAPRDAAAAVNVSASEFSARYCGIPHVVFISDACRTAAEGGAGQRITGSDIFPNDGNSVAELPVDLFFACALGRPALEVRDAKESSKQFTALYTAAFLDSLTGRHSMLLDWVVEDGKEVAYVRPTRLKEHLKAEVPRRLAELTLEATAIQVPDARITSGPAAWIARLAEVPKAAPPAISPPPPQPTLESASSDLLKTVLHEGPSALERAASEVRQQASSGLESLTIPPPVAEVVGFAAEAAEPFGPMHQETGCGFKIRGGRFAGAHCQRATVDYCEPGGDLVRMRDVPAPGAGVLLLFDNGLGTVLPALPGFLTSLTFEGNELVDVAYEPSDHSDRWREYEGTMVEARALRAVVASATRSGVFRLETEDAIGLARRMQHLKGRDPTLGVYAAYAYHELQRRDLIREMSRFMQEDLGARLFDVALLATELRGTTPAERARTEDSEAILGPFPLLAQGWPLLMSQRVVLPPLLADIQLSLVPSLWSLFDKEGCEKIHNAIKQNDIL